MRVRRGIFRHARVAWPVRIAGPALAAALGSAAAIPGALAQDAAAVPGAEAWDSARAWSEMERLTAEIRLLNGLASAQAALLALNRERAASGTGPAVLSARLCADPALAPWCRALTATFGEGAVETERAEGKK